MNQPIKTTIRFIGGTTTDLRGKEYVKNYRY